MAVHLLLPRAKYDEMQGVCNASLCKVALLKTPAHAWNAFLAPNRPPSQEQPRFRIGTHLHQRILEPQIWEQIIPCSSGATTKAFAEAVKAAAANGKTVAQASEYELADAMGKSILSHPAVGAYFEPTEDNLKLNEITLTWVDPVTEMSCRGRLDAIRILDEEILVIDLKTTVDAGPQEFGKSAANFLYLLQASFYCDAVHYNRFKLEEVLGLPLGSLNDRPIAFEFVCVEKEQPHQVARYRMTAEQADMGRKLYQKALNLVKTATSLNWWSGYDNAPQPLQLPNWAWSQMEQLLLD